MPRGAPVEEVHLPITGPSELKMGELWGTRPALPMIFKITSQEKPSCGNFESQERGLRKGPQLSVQDPAGRWRVPAPLCVCVCVPSYIIQMHTYIIVVLHQDPGRCSKGPSIVSRAKYRAACIHPAKLPSSVFQTLQDPHTRSSLRFDTPPDPRRPPPLPCPGKGICTAYLPRERGGSLAPPPVTLASSAHANPVPWP